MDENLQGYARLARYYRALAEQRGHFNKQVALVELLFQRYGISKSMRILDAACGSADVVARLCRLGYEHVEGVDGCKELLDYGRGSAEYDQIKLTCCQWKDIGRVLDQKVPFDCILVLGNAIGHYEPRGLEVLFEEFRRHLRPGGLLVVDLRNWVTDSAGRLRDPTRPERVYRWLGEITVGDERFWMDDYCDYDTQRQRISYRFRRLKPEGFGWDFEDGPITVSYALFSIQDAVAWLRKAGFPEHSIEAHLPDGWSYIIVTATR